MAEALARKKRVRAGHRASATRMITRATALLDGYDPDPMKLSQLKLSLQEKLDVLKQLDGEIVGLVDEETVADEIEQSDGFKEEVYIVMIRIDGRARATSRGATTPSPTPPSPGGGASVAAASTRDATVKLPKLTIQPFKGDLTTWTTFWDSYKAAIHDNASLSDIDKFNYLRSLLQGSALDAVSGLTLTAANYKEGISVLERRFGNKQQIVAKHMDILLNVDPVTSSHNLKGLRHLCDTIESQVRGLKSLGVSADSYGSLLSSVLLNKLPQELRLILSRGVGDDEWKLDRLMELLEEEVQARERATASSQATSRRPVRGPPTAATLLTGGSETVQTPTCYYCQQSHLASNCGVVKTPDERKRVLREKGRCFNCLRRGHVARQCRSKSKCTHCRGRHHSSICERGESGPPAQNAGGEQSNTQQSSGMNPSAPAFQPPTTSLWINSNQGVLLQTAQVVVFNPDDPQRSKRVRVVLDSGSQRSYITERLHTELALQTKGEQSMAIVTFGSRGERSRVCNVVDVRLELRNGRMRDLTVFAVPIICQPLTCQPITLCRDSYKHLKGLPLADSSDGSDTLEVDVLIGCDHYWSFITGKTKRGDNGPVGVHTELGWVLSGPVGPISNTGAQTTLVTHTLHVECVPQQNEQSLDECLKSFWDLESFGITQPDRTTLDEFQDSIRLVDGRYEVSLPWKDSCPVLPDNYQLSLRRLRGLLLRLRKDEEVFAEYDAIIKNQIQQGIVELVRPSENVARVHYLPHHGVIRRDKETTKLRIVYDASARANGPSLNDCLHAGPKFDQKILDLLLRFRAHRVALTADIEKAFLMVAISEKDRNVLRFLWVDDITKESPEPVALRFTRVVFGVSSSPFLLNATIRFHLEQHALTQPDLIAKLMRSFYVDDVVTGASDEDQAYALYETSKKVLKEGGFHLRKFCTNSTLLQMRIDGEETSTSQTSTSSTTGEAEETYSNSTLCPTQGTQLGERKVLGIRWDISTDQLVVSLEDIAYLAVKLDPTKRAIVSLVGKFYDPLGLLSPVVINFKIFLQELCEARLGWDQPLTGKLLEKWRCLSSSLRESQPIFTPRCYLDGIGEQDVSYSLCGFCDSSLKAYAAMIYLVIETPDGRHTRFVASKTRVAPLKTQTIPRLELLSALLLSRLTASVTQAVEDELQLSEPHCFTDSTVALFWIQGVEKIWKAFVQNRVSEIRKLLPPGCWAHCSGRDNPADLPSRGLTPRELAASQLWRHGPDWLKTNELSCEDLEVQMPEECKPEMKISKVEVSHSLLVRMTTSAIGQLLKCEDFSSFRRLIAVTAIVLKVCQIFLKCIRPEPSTCIYDDQTRAEILWLVESQQELVKDKNFKLWKGQFNLFQDDDKVWRCGGRIQNANVSFTTKHPALLSAYHGLTILLVKRAHERVMHSGVKATLTELRSQFWILKGRSVVKAILRKCTVCRRFEGNPYCAPPPPPLPPFRLEEAPPFTHTGVDFAGPLYVRQPDGTSSKTWICLYTCCVIRAIHLDLVPDLSAATFIRSLKRFASRRGLPTKMVSDNGKTFKAAARIIESIVTHSKVQQHLAGLGVRWIFNLPKAPWWGGMFERLIGSMKRCLRKVIGQAKLSYDELLTAVVEAEAVINSRPLTYVSSDDLDEPLTPAHLLTGRRLLSLPDYISHGCEDIDDVERELLDRRARHLNVTLNQFWERWRKEYLLELRESHRYHQGHANPSQVSVDDVVVVHSTEQPRAFWRLGRVEEVLVGKDGETRGAVLRVVGGGRRSTLLQRPIKLLYPLEVPRSRQKTSSEDQDVSSVQAEPPPECTRDSNDVCESSISQRPQRAAAAQARDRLMAQALSED